jgi:hypothetical protein
MPKVVAAPIVHRPDLPARPRTGRVILLAIGVLVLAVSVRVGYELSKFGQPKPIVVESPPPVTAPVEVASASPEPTKPAVPEPTPAKRAEPAPSKPVGSASVAVVKPPGKPEPSVPSRPAPTFARDVQPIVTAKCITCHGRDNKKKGGLDLRTLDGLHKGGESGQVVAGGQLEKSLLWESVDNGTMPPGKPKLTSAEKDTLRRWIESGAK